MEGFLVNERSYVSSLERLIALRRTIDLDGSVQNDTLNGLLRMLNPIVDTQRRFLLAIEMMAHRSLDEQAWATPFTIWSERSSLYADFIASEKSAMEFIRTVIAEREPTKDKVLSSVLGESLQLLHLPSQRLPKYVEFLQVCPLSNSCYPARCHYFFFTYLYFLHL